MTEKGYSIRPFESGDLGQFLGLYREVFDSYLGEDWFAWKYLNNPYVESTPILVAERDGELVGARPFFGLSMRVDGTPVTAFQPSDTMVHPDHRRRGLFTRMTEAAIDRYGGGEPAFFFNFPNPNSLPGYRRMGWDVVGELPTLHRIQDPAALVRSRVGNPLGRVVAPLTPVTRAYLRLLKWRAPRVPAEVSVSRRSDVPAEALSALYDDRPPDAVHAVRDRTFYRWRFRDAPRPYSAYVGLREGTARAGLVMSSGTDGSSPVTTIVDVVPAVSDADCQDVFVALLQAVLEDSREAASILAPGKLLLPAVQRWFGLYDRRTPGLSRFTRPAVHAVRTLDDGGSPSQTVAGVDLRRADNWHLSFAETDYS